jgi:hypothetical protein
VVTKETRKNGKRKKCAEEKMWVRVKVKVRKVKGSLKVFFN